jgi:hypothetical protein
MHVPTILYVNGVLSSIHNLCLQKAQCSAVLACERGCGTSAIEMWNFSGRLSWNCCGRSLVFIVTEKTCFLCIYLEINTSDLVNFGGHGSLSATSK